MSEELTFEMSVDESKPIIDLIHDWSKNINANGNSYKIDIAGYEVEVNGTSIGHVTTGTHTVMKERHMDAAYDSIENTRRMDLDDIVNTILSCEEGYGVMRAFGAEDGEDKLRTFLFVLMEKLRISSTIDTRIVKDILKYLGCDDERQLEVLRKSLLEKLKVFHAVLTMP